MTPDEMKPDRGQTAEAVRWGMGFARLILADGDWDETIDVMLAREWELRHSGIPWEIARPLVKQGWLRGRERLQLDADV